MQPSPRVSRRQFLSTSAVAAGAVALGPGFVRASDKSGSQLPIVGEGDHTYECHHDWTQMPEGWRWGAAHAVTFDADGTIYMTHQLGGPEQDAVAVLDPTGKFIRSFGKAYHGGGHGLDIRVEEGTPYLYLSDVKNCLVAKLSLDGEEVWRAGLPGESKLYVEGKRYVPTNVAFHPDGSLFVADGYGSSYIHHYTADGKYLSSFGGAGTEAGQLRTPHGIWWDTRPGRTPELAVADRGNSRLQYFNAEGTDPRVATQLPHPCGFDPRGELMVIADLWSRVSLLDGNNDPIVHLGDDPAWTQRVKAEGLRTKPAAWQPGKFVCPHDAAFDPAGNIIVMEWTDPGRITFLKKV